MIILSILVPTYNGRYRLDQLILSLYTHGYVLHDSVEILISDNASDDGTREYLEALPDDFAVLFNNSNLGYSGNALKLLNSASGLYTWLVGDDDIVDVDANILLPFLNISSSRNVLFVEEQECNMIRSAAPKLYSTLIMPFGFIGSCIQPNTHEFKELFETYSYNKKHDSPHFFARWSFYLQHGSSCVHSLGNIRLLTSPPSPPRPRILTVLSLFLQLNRKDYSLNWYYAYKLAICLPHFTFPASFIASAFHSQVRHDLTVSLWVYSLYWTLRLPFLCISDISYAFFMINILTYEFFSLVFGRRDLLR